MFMQCFQGLFKTLNLLKPKREQTLMAFISLKNYNNAPWAYNGRDKSEIKTPKSTKTHASHERILFSAI